MMQSPYEIIVNIGEQTLTLFSTEQNSVVKQYQIATAKNGPGEHFGSECTPRGQHIIRAKIGTDAPSNTVFVGRRPTGEIYDAALRQAHPHRDWILTRILWLSGKEPGINRLGKQDTMRRYVYIHGCPEEDPMGIPSSHGCVKMRNAEIIELFDLVPVYTPVLINE